MVFSELKIIALFEFLPYKWFTEKFTATTKAKYLEAYNSDSFLESMGAMFAIGVVLSTLIGITLLLSKLCNCSTICTKLLAAIK